MADTEQQVEQLSEIQQLRREGKFKDAGGSAVFCVICEKKSYPAETVNFEKLPYHKDCFKCTKCSKKIEGGFNASIFEYNLYCRGCFATSGFNRAQAQVKWQPKASGASTTYNPAFSGLGGGAEVCKACNKACYSAEAVLFEKNKYHPDCLRCQEDGCGVLCTVAQLNKFDEKIYCTSCWNKGDYRRKQLDLAKAAPKASGAYNPAFAGLGGGGSKCTGCGKTCYTAETITFEKQPYHAECLKCSECKVKMTLSQANKFEENIFCTKCWANGGYSRKQVEAAKTWQPKESTGEVSAQFAGLGGASSSTKCKTCTKTVYPAEQVLYETHYYHPLCFKCTHCNNRIENIGAAMHNKKEPYCKKCFQQLELYRADKA
eukprot:UN01411